MPGPDEYADVQPPDWLAQVLPQDPDAERKKKERDELIAKLTQKSALAEVELLKESEQLKAKLDELREESLKNRSERMNDQLTPEQAESLRKQLCKYYRDQVLPVSEVCAALRAWSEVAQAHLQGYLDYENDGKTIRFDSLFLAAEKSSLLGRMLYGREKLRTEQCPRCKGQWRGLYFPATENFPGNTPDGCGCGGCGWLPNKESK